MSKKHKKQGTITPSEVITGNSALVEEYSVIKRDLVKVILLNVLYLAGVLALYFSNKQTHYLEHWFNKIFHF